MSSRSGAVGLQGVRLQGPDVTRGRRCYPELAMAVRATAWPWIYMDMSPADYTFNFLLSDPCRLMRLGPSS